MATLSTLVDDVLKRLNDDGTLFTRAEVTRWLSEGLRRIAVQSKHARTFTALDMPPRHFTAITHQWESNLANGSYRKWTFTHQNGQRECTFLWEAQAADEAPIESHLRAVSNLWEITTQAGEVDAPYRFYLPKNESIVYSVWHDHERLISATTSTLDTLEDRWWSIDGEPFLYTQGLGPSETFEIFEIDTEYRQSYDHVDRNQGFPRSFSGDRTYSVDSESHEWGYAYAWNGESAAPSTQLTGIGRRFTQGPEHDTVNDEQGFFYTHDWEGQQHRGEEVTVSTFVAETNPLRFDPDVDPPVGELFNLAQGIFRKGVSTSRQYFPSSQWNVLGGCRAFGSSDDAVLVWHSVLPPDTPSEEAEINIIPDQVRKYLIYYAMGVLLNRQGEGYDPALAEHYNLRASRGPILMHKLGNVSRAATTYTRGVTGRSTERGNRLPRLPSNFPRAPWLRD